MILKIIALSIGFLILSCSTTPEKQPPQVATAKQVKDFKAAEKSYKAGKLDLALKEFQKFAQMYPGSDLQDEARYYEAQIYYSKGDYASASKSWMAIVDSPYKSNLYGRSYLGALSSLTQLGESEKALTLIRNYSPELAADPKSSTGIYELSAKLKLQRADSMGALSDLIDAMNFAQESSEKSRLLGRAAGIVDTTLSPDQLNEVVSGSKFFPIRLNARYRLATFLFEKKDWDGARRQFKDVMDSYPDSGQARQAQSYLSLIESQQRVDSHTIGVILPLSGKFSQTGYKTLRGLQLGLGLLDPKQQSPFKLAIIDSGGSPELARRGVERLVREDNVVAIIGDVLSKPGMAVASKAQELGVPNISLAQKKEITEAGEFVFRNALTPEIETGLLVAYAMSTKNIRRFAVAFPNDSYGVEYANAFWEQVLARGGEVTAAQPYKPEETDFRQVVRRMVGTFYKEDRDNELQLRIKEWKKKNKAISERNDPPDDILPPQVDFDAVFVPDSPSKAGQFAAMLAYNDVQGVSLLGTNAWNTSEFVERAGKLSEGALFMHQFFSPDPGPVAEKFSKRFQNQFGYAPKTFEALGYDSALLVAEVLRSSDFSLTRGSLRDRLIGARIEAGSTGPVTINLRRDFEKPLTPLTVKDGKIVKLEIAEGPAQKK